MKVCLLYTRSYFMFIIRNRNWSISSEMVHRKFQCLFVEVWTELSAPPILLVSVGSYPGIFVNTCGCIHFDYESYKGYSFLDYYICINKQTTDFGHMTNI